VNQVDFDVIVVGAGPAGSAAALTAAKAGAKVLLLERGPEPGSKNVSGAMVRISEIAEVFSSKDIPVERNVKSVKLIVHSPSGEVSVDVKVSGGLGNVGRLKLDRWMAQQAEAAGAVLVTKTTALGLEWDRGEAKAVITDRGKVSGRAFVLSEGVNALISIQSGLRPDLKPEEAVVTVKEVYAMNKDEVNRRFSLKEDAEGVSWRFLFDKPLPGAGFLYTYRDAVAVGVGVPMSSVISSKVKPEKVLEEFQAFSGIREIVKEASLREYSSKVIPEAGFPSWRSSRSNVYLAGDALGLINPITFDGIGPAVSSGALAGRAAAEGWGEEKYRVELLRNRNVRNVVGSRGLSSSLLSKLDLYVNLLPSLMVKWVQGDLLGMREESLKVMGKVAQDVIKFVTGVR
jgi:electron transfer flavoprotein-quinone oxidoreductase